CVLCVSAVNLLFKGSMQIPLPSLCDAEDPESLTRWIGDVEVVAGFVMPIPPPPANPFGTDLVDHLPGDPLVRKRRRVAFQVFGGRHHDPDFDRLRKKMKGPGGRRRGDAETRGRGDKCEIRGVTR